MSIHEDPADLRLEILKTLKLAHSSKLAKFFSFKTKVLLNALRPSGFPGLSENELWVEIVYLQKKGLLEIEKVKNEITEEEFDLVSITVKGIDLLQKRFSEMGVARDE